MTDVLEPASLIEAAQQAAAAGDYSTTERLLRDAAARQEAVLGAEHPDLATTLNNLAFVCERLSKFDEAERGYRRAHAIAVASLAPGHPLIKTSLTNLVDFCAARGIPLWAPPAPPPDAHVSATEPDVTAAAAPSTLRVPRAVIAVAALLVVAITLVFLMRQGQETSAAPEPEAQASPVLAPPVQPAPESTVAPTPAAPASSPSTAPAARVPEPVPPARPAGRADASGAPVTVLRAQLCSAIERTGSPDWQCSPATGELQPGRFSFYTRLMTAAPTTVEHRWYFGERLHQSRRMSLPAAPGNGYRTFSSNTVSPERAGAWRVELRAADGRLLHEERFIVR